MAPRANWKGFLILGELSCPVALYTAASTSDRVSFTTVNRKTGNKVSRQFIDSVSGDPVGSEHQIKGYEVSPDTYLHFEDDEIAEAMPDSDKKLAVECFVPCSKVDTIYFDKPYYLAPAEAAGKEAFELIRAALEKAQVVAIARTLLFRRLRTVMIRATDKSLIAETLQYDYEVREASEVFEDLPKAQKSGEMLDLAKHIIATKSGIFDPAAYDDRYETALQQLISAKLAGKTLPKAKPGRQEKIIDLMEALRASAKASDQKPAAKPTAKKKKTTTTTRAAGRQPRKAS